MKQEQRAERLVQTYADTILRLSNCYLKNTADAQDVCQTVLIKLCMEERAFSGTEHEKAWVLRTTVNACKDVLKSPWRQRTCDLEDCIEQAAPEAEENSVLASVNALPPKYQAVIYLYYYEGYRAEEIGKVLGVPTGTVHTRLVRGRKKLKWMLEEEAYGQPV